MAEEKESGSHTYNFWLTVGLLALLIFLWYAAGGPGKADLRGLFLAPPQPLGNGAAYGPTFGKDATTTPTAGSVDAPAPVTPGEGAYSDKSNQ